MRETNGGRRPRILRGYGWPATLELLSPPATAISDSRRSFKMIICPTYGSVHDDGGACCSRHGGVTSLVFDIPPTVMGNDNPLELNLMVIPNSWGAYPAE